MTAVEMTRRGLAVMLHVVCVAWPAAAQDTTKHDTVRVSGVVRDARGLPVAGAVVLVPSPRQDTPAVTSSTARSRSPTTTATSSWRDPCPLIAQ